jgi:hypothetical protein
MRVRQIAQNDGRFYRVDMQQARYFPVKKVEALAMLADGSAVEVPYLPFGRPELWTAYKEAQEAIATAAA